jgi:hypothetical protein
LAPKRSRGSVPFCAVKEVCNRMAVVAGFDCGCGVESEPMVLPGREAHKLQPAQRNNDSARRRSVLVPSADWLVATVAKPSSENVRVSAPLSNE